MGLGSEIRENVEKVKDVTKQSVRNAGYYVVDTIDDIKFEKKLEREMEAQKQKEERQKKQERAKECKKILEEAGIEDVGTMYEQKKRELDSLEEQLRQEEKALAQTHQEFKDYRAKSKTPGITFAMGVVVFVIAFFSSLWLLIPAAILVILAFVYFCTVVEFQSFSKEILTLITCLQVFAHDNSDKTNRKADTVNKRLRCLNIPYEFHKTGQGNAATYTLTHNKEV